MMAVLVAVPVLLGLLGIAIYNGLISKKNAIENAFGTIDVQLKQRHDLIPNLVASVKNYMQHEKSILETLTRLRADSLKPDLTNAGKVEIENQISKSMGSLMVAVENYPQLKADGAFISLQKSLNEVEAQISAARRTYNAAVTEFNNGVEMFPSSMVAGMMGLKRASVLEALENERKNVNVESLFNP